jgi:ABC-2 type transport system permease protein
MIALLAHTWRLQRIRLALVSLGLSVWGFLLPVIYARFGSQFSALMESGLLPQPFTRFGGGDIFSLAGSIALGFIHPISIILTSVFAVGFAASTVAGERQRGTLEVALARPISRRRFYLAALAATFGLIAASIGALVAGSLLGAAFSGVLDELALRRVPLLWLNALLLFGAFAAIGLAASVSFDRLAPALGWALAITIVSYVLEVLGSLWPAAAFLQPYSLFHYLQPKAILAGMADAIDLAILAIVIALAIAFALIVFPRRDLAAPS